MGTLKFSLLLLLVALGAPSVNAAGDESITIVGRAEATVTTGTIRLGDIAQVSSVNGAHDESIIALENINIERSPDPGTSSSLSGRKVVERLKVAGVDFGRVRYMFPRATTVWRAGRALSEEEIRAAIEEMLANGGRDFLLKTVQVQGEAMVAPGEITVLAQNISAVSPGSNAIEIRVKDDSGSEKIIRVNALIDEYRNIPVAARSIPKGAVVSDGDVRLARVNMVALAKDSAIDPTRVVGLETSVEIGAGETFRATKLIVPPIIEQGNKVSIIYQSSKLTATATGTAMESGARGSTIRVRNENSKRILSAKVLDPGVVGVTQ